MRYPIGASHPNLLGASRPLFLGVPRSFACTDLPQQFQRRVGSFCHLGRGH